MHVDDLDLSKENPDAKTQPYWTKKKVLTKGTFLLNWDEVWNLFRQGMGSRKLQGPVVCRPISDNPGLTFNQGFFDFAVQKPFRENFPYSF